MSESEGSRSESLAPTLDTTPTSPKITHSAPTQVAPSQEDEGNLEISQLPLSISESKETKQPPKSQQCPLLNKVEFKAKKRVTWEDEKEAAPAKPPKTSTESQQSSLKSSEASPKKKSFGCNSLIDLDTGLMASFTNEDPSKNTRRPGYCKEEFETSLELKNHLRDHTGEKPYQCPECSLRFSNRGARREHLNAVHQIQREAPKRDNPEVVEIQGPSKKSKPLAVSASIGGSTNELSQRRPKNFQGLSLLSAGEPLVSGRSMMRQSGPRTGARYMCPYCEKNNYSMQQLQVHVRTHTGEKPYNCRFCELTFTQKGNRNTHEKKYHTEQYIEAHRRELMVLGLNHPAAVDLFGPPQTESPAAYGTMGFGPGQYMPLEMLQNESSFNP